MKAKAEEKKHEMFSASGAERWVNCPGSIALTKRAPPKPSSKYADEGTLAHDCLEVVLKNWPRVEAAKKYLTEARVKNDDGETVRKYDDNMIAHAVKSAKLVMSWKSGDDEMLCETKVKLDFIHEEFGGTFDAAVVQLFGRLTVIDYKYGAGVAVEAEGNLQMLVYALGLAHRYDYCFDEIRLVIIQPRADHDSGPVRDWVVKLDELLEYKKTFTDAVKLALKKDAPLNADPKWCRWCAARPICPAISTKALVDAKSPTKIPDAKSLAPADIGKALVAFEHLETWMASVRDHAFTLLQNGTKVPGFKLVNKRALRQWKNEAEARTSALSLFGGDAIETNLLSPAQLEKVGGAKAKAFTEKHAHAISSGLTIARDTDPRPEVDALANIFGDDTEDEQAPEEMKPLLKAKKTPKTKGKKNVRR